MATQQAAQTQQAPNPEFIQLASDGNRQAGNKDPTGSTPGSNVLFTWTNEILRQSTRQAEFQMPDVRCARGDLAIDICVKIWKNECINLAALLKKNKIRRGDVTCNLFINEHGHIQTRPKVVKEIINVEFRTRQALKQEPWNNIYFDL